MPRQPLRVLHLTTDGRLAGAERLLLGVADHADRERVALHFCTLTAPGAFGAEVLRRGLPFTAIGCGTWVDTPKAVVRLQRVLERERIDLLHTHLLHASALGQLTVRWYRRRPRTILTRHYTDFFHRFGTSWSRWLDQWATGRADHVIAVSRGAKEVLIEKERVRPEKVTVIHNGIDVQQASRVDQAAVHAFRATWGLDGRVVIGTLGALHPRKGHRYFLQALAQLSSRYPMLTGILVGEGPLRASLERDVHALGLTARVIFTGYCANPSVALAAMDVVVHPSLEEGFGMTILEALILGKPLIAARVGGIPEIVEDGKSGLLVDPADPAALAESIDRLMMHREFAGTLAASGRERVANEFSIQRMCRQYERLYEQVVGRHPVMAVA